jgi:hypothetical protein
VSNPTLPSQRCAYLALLALACSCDVATSIGNACPGGVCREPPDCSGADQQFPDGCDGKGRTCHLADVPDDEAVCGSCMSVLDELNIGAAVGPCACTYCAVQLRSCFESAIYEPTGDAQRDADCLKVIECGWANDCAGSECYCGAGVERDTCLREANEGNAQGPCAELIEAVVECDPEKPIGSCIFANQQTGGTVLNRAADVSLCVRGDPHQLMEIIEPKCPFPPDAGAR